MCKEQVNQPQPPFRPWADAGCDVHVIDGATIREWSGGIVVNDINVIAHETLETPADGAPVGTPSPTQGQIDHMAEKIKEANE